MKSYWCKWMGMLMVWLPLLGMAQQSAEKVEKSKK